MPAPTAKQRRAAKQRDAHAWKRNTRRKARTIVHGAQYMTLHPNGNISYGTMAPSGEWRVTGAVERNNFGHAVRHYTLEQILREPSSIPWRNANGTQRTFIQDFDHGTAREWRNPTHLVY